MVCALFFWLQCLYLSIGILRVKMMCIYPFGLLRSCLILSHNWRVILNEILCFTPCNYGIMYDLWRMNTCIFRNNLLFLSFTFTPVLARHYSGRQHKPRAKFLTLCWLATNSLRSQLFELPPHLFRSGVGPLQAGGSKVQGHLWLYSKLEVSVGYIRPCLKTK